MASQPGPGGPWPTGARWRVLGVNPGCGFPAGGGGADPGESGCGFSASSRGAADLGRPRGGGVGEGGGARGRHCPPDAAATVPPMPTITPKRPVPPSLPSPLNAPTPPPLLPRAPGRLSPAPVAGKISARTHNCLRRPNALFFSRFVPSIAQRTTKDESLGGRAQSSHLERSRGRGLGQPGGNPARPANSPSQRHE